LPSIHASTSSVYAMLSVYTVLVHLSTSTPRRAEASAPVSER
jgi:hypothetical protein